MGTFTAIVGIAIGAGALLGAFVVLGVLPLFARLRSLCAEAERLLRQLNGDLPVLMQQTSRTLKNLDGTLVEHLPTLLVRTRGTLDKLDGSLSNELPSLIKEATHTVRRINGTTPLAGE